MNNALAFTAPGLKAARDDGEVSLYGWQAHNVRRLVAFLQYTFHSRVAGQELPPTEGYVLCDAPGGGKTVSVLSTIVRTMPSTTGRCVVIFAPKVIVPQWAVQMARHFDAAISGLRIFCDDKQLHVYDGAVAPLSQRETLGARGGVYIEQRPSAALPPTAVLATFQVVVLPKEMLSLRTDKYARKEKNDIALRHLRHAVRLVVIDESHNLSSHGAISNQLLNVEAFAGVPKLLMSGTPGTSPRRLYDMLALIRHASWRAGGGYKRWQAARFLPGAEHLVLPHAERALVGELNSCFLHTPAHVIFAQREPQRSMQPIAPSDVESESYNYVLSLHQRDVLRAGVRATRPAEWKDRHRLTKQPDWQLRERKGLKEPSAEKTIVDLMVAANGGELWGVALKGTNGKPLSGQRAIDKLPHEHPEYLDNVLNSELPSCHGCGLMVPGVVSLPCACNAHVCAECFRAEVQDFRAHCSECKQPRTPFKTWVKAQPWLDVQTSADFEFEQMQTISTHVQQQMHLGPASQRIETVLLRQPAPRPFERVAVATNESLAARSDSEIEDLIRDYSKVCHLALMLKKLRYPLGAAGPPSDAKVLLVPPAHKDVREEFILSLRGAIGRDAIADLNDKPDGKGQSKQETSMSIAKFRRGRGFYWQCPNCGETHEEATPACSTATFRIRLEVGNAAAVEGVGEANGGTPQNEVLRFITDVEKVTPSGEHDNSPIFIDNRVAVKEPGQRRRTHDPYGKVLAKGSCNGKRPAQPSELIPAPAGSCFVLILNASGIEGLDLGEATHLIKTEPMQREDKELQAEARIRRLGTSGQLQIVQMLMRGTIEEAAHDEIAETRKQQPHAKRANAAKRDGKKDRKRARVEDEASDQDEQGRQAKMLHALKLLRKEEEEEEEEEEGAAGAAGSTPG